MCAHRRDIRTKGSTKARQALSSISSPEINDEVEATRFSGAGFGRRLLARLIDWQLYWMVWGLVSWGALSFVWITRQGAGGDPALSSPDPAGSFAALMLFYALSALCESLSGQTPGKLLLGLTVVDVRSGERPALLVALIRNFALWIDMINLGQVALSYMLRSTQQQRYGDWLAATVVRRGPHRPASEGWVLALSRLTLALMIGAALLLGLALWLAAA